MGRSAVQGPLSRQRPELEDRSGRSLSVLFLLFTVVSNKLLSFASSAEVISHIHPGRNESHILIRLWKTSGFGVPVRTSVGIGA